MLNKFKKIGEYREPNADPVYEEYIGRAKSVIVPIVYLLVVGQKIKYVGESRRGYSRPLSYHKNKIMRRQREGILATVNDGQIVEVFALEVPHVKVKFNGASFNCYVAQDYEKHLIAELMPEWNGRT